MDQRVKLEREFAEKEILKNKQAEFDKCINEKNIKIQNLESKVSELSQKLSDLDSLIQNDKILHQNTIGELEDQLKTCRQSLVSEKSRMDAECEAKICEMKTSLTNSIKSDLKIEYEQKIEATLKKLAENNLNKENEQKVKFEIEKKEFSKYFFIISLRNIKKDDFW